MTLKARAALYLVPLIIAYASVVATLSRATSLGWRDFLAAALPASGLLVISHLLQDIIPKQAKEIVVFFRLRDRLPGCRAYSHICRNDVRISESFLDAICASNDMSGKAQNARWYSQYRKVNADPTVKHANLRFLAWRDMTSTLVVLAFATPILVPFSVLGWPQAVWVSVGCLTLSLITGTAARNAAVELVMHVVALEAADAAH